MSRDVVQLGYFFALLLGVAVLTGLVFLPYIPAIFFAVVLAIVFYPVHTRILKAFGGRSWIASIVSTLLVLFVIIIPLIIFSVLLAQEASRLLSLVASSELDIRATLVAVVEWVGVYVPGSLIGYFEEYANDFNAQQYLAERISWILESANVFFGEVFRLIVAGAISLLAVFYLFHDGERAIRYVERVTPLARGYETMILQRMKHAVNSVVLGRVLIGVIQGVLTGVALAIVGVPAPVLWGAIAAVLSVVPMLGPGLIITPIALYFIAIGSMWSGVGLLIWAFLAIYFVDDIFGPILIGRGVKIHPFLILISILGGIALFGPIGFVAGPVLVALLFVLLDMYPMVLERELSAKGADR
ncbi:MAG: AI-2E family transporter [Candidatus Paceibacterota bacterium]